MTCETGRCAADSPSGAAALVQRVISTTFLESWLGLILTYRLRLGAQALEVGAELRQHAGGQAVALAEQAEHEVLRADVVTVQLARLFPGEVDHLPRAGRERWVLALA